MPRQLSYSTVTCFIAVQADLMFFIFKNKSWFKRAHTATHHIIEYKLNSLKHSNSQKQLKRDNCRVRTLLLVWSSRHWPCKSLEDIFKWRIPYNCVHKQNKQRNLNNEEYNVVAKYKITKYLLKRSTTHEIIDISLFYSCSGTRLDKGYISHLL